tara:strand:+ start:1766 stop:2608 length:843 start_codon:yes stop_codon:yes gene_type:complete
LKFKTLLVSSFFKKNKKYLSNFVNSINDQSDQDFDILLTLDKSNYDYFLKKLKKRNRKINILKERLPIKLNKFNILKKIKNLKYQNIILQDSDDICDRDRVKITKDLLKKNNFIVGDLIIDKKKIFSKYFKNNQKLNISNLLNGNIAGFGNTAFKKKIITESRLKKIRMMPNNLKAIDWNIWLVFFYNLKKIIFSSDIQIYYSTSRSSLTSLSRVNLKKFKENIEVNYETFLNASFIHKKYLSRFNYILENYINCDKKNFYKKFKLFETKHKKIWFYLPS